MYTRIAQCTITSGKNAEFTRVLNNEVLPELARQSGFVDAIALYGNTEPGSVMSITFWQNKELADKYGREVFSRLIQKLQAVSSNWTVEGYNVETSTMHRIATGKAA